MPTATKPPREGLQMRTDDRLRQVTPEPTEPLDHVALQRRGRRARRLTHGVMALALAGVVGGVAIAVNQVQPPRPVVLTQPTPEAPSLVPIEPASGASSADEHAAEPECVEGGHWRKGDGLPASSGAVDDTLPTTCRDELALEAGTWSGMDAERALDVLRERLDATGERPEGLFALQVVIEAGRGEARIRRIEPGTPDTDSPVGTVLAPDFDGGETPGYLWTWNQDAAHRALDGLQGDGWVFRGPGIDRAGRSVVIFAAPGSGQEVHLDPDSGYTTGALVTGGWSDSELNEMGERLLDEEEKPE